MTEKRLSRISKVVSHRQKGLTLVLENIHDSHNVSAIFRSAESAGVDKIYLVYNTNKFPKIGRISSGSAKKWVELFRFKNIPDCYEVLRKEKYTIYNTYIDNPETINVYPRANNDQGISKEKLKEIAQTIKTKSLYDLDLTKPSAIVIGNEHTGVSEDAVKMSDGNFMVPMYGMVESLNVSVTAAICIYEALRQREIKNMYKEPGFTKKETEEKLKFYLSK